jgi:phosphatidylglycerophosphate synthase
VTKGIARRVPTLITCTRPVFTLFFIRFMLRGEMTAALAVFAAICLTDILDGMAARALKACTLLGAYLDVASDLF